MMLNMWRRLHTILSFDVWHAWHLNAVKWRARSDKGWSLLPGDEASYWQHQPQTVRLLCVSHQVVVEHFIHVIMALISVYLCAGTAARGDGGCCTSWRLSTAAPMLWSHFCWHFCRMPVPARGCSTKVNQELIQYKVKTSQLSVHHSRSAPLHLQVLLKHVSRIWGGLISTVDAYSTPTAWSSKPYWWASDSVISCGKWVANVHRTKEETTKMSQKICS